jgi:membrane-bound metal-dependent hydrolase YbcI (DUF457 family)
MFVGHLAVAFAGKQASPRVSLGWLVGAVVAADLLWPLLLLAGVERVRIVPGATAFTPLVFESYPWSHSLLMLLLWGAALGALARRAGAEPRALWLIAALVLSHWLLDVVTHAPDMPLWPGSSPRFGLGLWNSIPGTLAIEGALWTVGLTMYLRHRRARNWIGRIVLWSLIIVSTVMWAMGPFSPLPPSERGLAWFALIGWITVPWAVWADRSYVER